MHLRLVAVALAAVCAGGLAADAAAQLTIPSDPGPQPLVQREIRAQITARVGTTLASPMAGRIRELAVEDGDRFKQGEVLVRFDCAVQEGQLARALAVLEKNRSLLEMNNRLKKLGSVSGKEMAVNQADVAEANAEVSIMRAMVERCTVKAPFSGRVAGLGARNYQFIGEGQPLLEILDDSALELESIIPSRWLSWLKTGHVFEVAVDETGRTYEAKVTRMTGRVDPVSQSIKIYASLTSPADDLLPGMSGRALIAPPEEAVVSGAPASRMVP